MWKTSLDLLQNCSHAINVAEKTTEIRLRSSHIDQNKNSEQILKITGITTGAITAEKISIAPWTLMHGKSSWNVCCCRIAMTSNVSKQLNTRKKVSPQRFVWRTSGMACSSLGHLIALKIFGNFENHVAYQLQRTPSCALTRRRDVQAWVLLTLVSKVWL